MNRKIIELIKELLIEIMKEDLKEIMKKEGVKNESSIK